MNDFLQHFEDEQNKLRILIRRAQDLHIRLAVPQFQKCMKEITNINCWPFELHRFFDLNNERVCEIWKTGTTGPKNRE